jgi:hypothetical protein
VKRNQRTRIDTGTPSSQAIAYPIKKSLFLAPNRLTLEKVSGFQ